MPVALRLIIGCQPRAGRALAALGSPAENLPAGHWHSRLRGSGNRDAGAGSDPGPASAFRGRYFPGPQAHRMALAGGPGQATSLQKYDKSLGSSCAAERRRCGHSVVLYMRNLKA